MENNRVGDKELLVARGNEKCGKVCRIVWYMSENEEQNGGTSREVEVEWGTKETMDLSNGRFYHEVTSGG